MLKDWTNRQYSPTHRTALEALFDLSTCASTEIRKSAQTVLTDMLRKFPKLATDILPKILHNLTLYQSNYDIFKGSLYFLTATTEHFVTTSNWSHVASIWPALVQMNFVEDPKICNLIDTKLIMFIPQVYVTAPIESNHLYGDKMAQLFKMATQAKFTVPYFGKIEDIDSSIREANRTNREVYLQLIDKLVQTLEQSQL